MDKKEILDKLQPIFSTIFDGVQISESTTSSDIENWDSLANIKILMMVEKEFNISIDVSLIHHLTSVSQIIDIINKSIK